MKAKSRRRLLLSSVAMLLVAMLALGTATFAWFTNSTTARADKAKVTVAAPSGLVIAAVQAGGTPPTTGYASTIDISGLADKTLSPVSGNATASNGITFKTATVDSDLNLTGITASNTAEYIAFDIYGKLSATNSNGTTEVPKAVTFTGVTFTGSTPGTIVRCAYYVDNTRKGYMDFGTAQGRAVNPVTGTTVTAGLKVNANYQVTTTSLIGDTLTTAAMSNISVPNVTYADDDTAGTKIGTVYMWVEGQDESCNALAANTDVIGNTGNLTLVYELGDDVTP